MSYLKCFFNTNKVGNPLVADRNVINVFESLEVCVLYMIHTDRTVGYATNCTKLYTPYKPVGPFMMSQNLTE